MFCPSCGAKNNIEQKYCRACGLNLEQTAASMLEQFPDGQRLELQQQEKTLEKFGNIAFGGFVVVIGIALCWMIYFVFEKMVLSGIQPFSGILLIAFIVFAALTLGYVIWRESLKEKRQKIVTARGLDSLSESSSTKYLGETTFEPVPSVVEDTTELLVKNKPDNLN